MTIQNVAIIGASGTLGPSAFEALVTSKCFTVTVLARASSKSSFPTASKTIRIPDDGGTEDQLASALAGQDALVVTMPASRVEDSARLANACVKAGVKRFIPADFGSVDSTDLRCVELVPLYEQKTKSREYAQQLAEQHPFFSWTSLVCGHFFDHGLASGLLSFHVKEREATIFGDGNIRWSACTLSQVGRAVVAILQKEGATRNQMLYIQSFCTSQNEVLAILERVSGHKFSITYVSSDDFIKKKKQQMDDGDREATEQLVSVLGVTRANWEGKLANELLGLGTENVGEAVKAVWTSLD